MSGPVARLTRLERLAAGPADVPTVVIIAPDRWPLPAQCAYRRAVAAGDRAAMADIVAAQTGQRPAVWGERVSIVEVVGVDPADI